MKEDLTQKSIDILKKQGLTEYIKQRPFLNYNAIQKGYCCDVEGCCEEDRCDCASYRGLTFEEFQKKYHERTNRTFQG